MFARPVSKKEDKKKQEVKKPIPIKRTLFSNTKINIQRPNQQVMNKITSIRTLPPFAYLNSESGNSQRHSETNSEIWKEEQELFETASNKNTQSIDQQLEDVLETIRMERKIIDLKIMKLKTKLQQITVKNSRIRTKQIVTSQDQAVCTDSTNIGLNTSRKAQLSQKQIQTISAQKKENSQYYREVMHSLQLDSLQGFKQIQYCQLDDQTKITQNKQILSVLLDLL